MDSNLTPQAVSSTTTKALAIAMPIIAILYSCAVVLFYRYAQHFPKPINKTSGLRLQRYGPAVYAFLVLGSLIEISLCIWLLVQYQYNYNYPNTEILAAIHLLLFTAFWTITTATIYMLCFFHPIWSRHPAASIGSHAIWILITWTLWIAGTAVLNGSAPLLYRNGICTSLVYCSQLQALFAFSVLEIVALTVGMMTLIWLAWRSTGDLWQKASARA